MSLPSGKWLHLELERPGASDPLSYKHHYSLPTFLIMQTGTQADVVPIGMSITGSVSSRALILSALFLKPILELEC
jgi:hypothetical protein